MKKLLAIIFIIGIPLLVFFQYQNYRRFHPPVNYEHPISDSIDVNYHDQALVKEYFTNAVELGAFARDQWFNHDIDVRFPDANNTAAKNAAKYYNMLASRTKMLEKKLKQSWIYKMENYSNEEIILIEKGANPDFIKYHVDREDFIGLGRGDNGQAVWDLQKILNSKGFNMPVDGTFGIETENSLKAFQDSLNIFSSGILDEETFEVLFKE
jgi:hypothetical protein